MHIIFYKPSDGTNEIYAGNALEGLSEGQNKE